MNLSSVLKVTLNKVILNKVVLELELKYRQDPPWLAGQSLLYTGCKGEESPDFIG